MCRNPWLRDAYIREYRRLGDAGRVLRSPHLTDADISALREMYPQELVDRVLVDPNRPAAFLDIVEYIEDLEE